MESNMKLPSFTITFVGLLSLITINIIYADSSNTKLQINQLNKTPIESAIESALEYTGFNSAKNLSLADVERTAKIVTISDDKTPFLHKMINNKPIWRLIFSDVPIKYLRTGVDSIYEYPRTFEVLIDSASGRLLKIHYIADNYDTDISPIPPADIAEKQMQNIHELYLGFPENPPKISFIDAYENNGLPLDKEITAIYVIDSGRGVTPKPVWIIGRRGLPPMPMANSGRKKNIPENQRNHVRTIIDAETGDGLLFDNLPQ
jgi:hypothetical protein